MELPTDVIHIILEYDGRIKYRHGKYMNRISKSDERYNMLKQLRIPKPVLYTMSDISLPEHFEYKVEFTKGALSVWNIYYPPNKIQYFFYINNFMTVYYRT